MGEQLVTIEAIRAAAQRLRGVAQRTPVELSRAASELVGHPTLLKCEHLQRTGSFKIRGAYNLISQLSDAERARGVACASAGNHAQGVALSAALLGVKSMVFMPTDAPLPKVDGPLASYLFKNSLQHTLLLHCRCSSIELIDNQFSIHNIGCNGTG